MSITILGETLSYLRFNLVWPKVGQELKPEKSYYIRFVLMSLSTTVVPIGCAAHLIVSLQCNSKNTGEDLVIVVAYTGLYYFITTFVLNQRGIAKICVDLSLDKPPNFEECNKRLEFLSKTFKYFINVVMINVCLWPFMSKRYCERQNLHRDFEEICGLLVTTWMPFDIDYVPVKQIFYLWQCYAAVMIMEASAMISLVLMEIMEHLIMRIQHLKYLILRAVNTDDDVLRQKRFSTCILYHINIFDIGRRIDKHYKMCLFSHIIITGAVFGCMGYTMMEGFSLNIISIFNGWLLSLCIISRSGQNLIDEALSVADVVYGSRWYQKNVSFQKSLVFLIMRSHKPIVVHTGPFSHLSHAIILSVFNTAYSYLTLLNATSE